VHAVEAAALTLCARLHRSPAALSCFYAPLSLVKPAPQGPHLVCRTAYLSLAHGDIMAQAALCCREYLFSGDAQAASMQAEAWISERAPGLFVLGLAEHEDDVDAQEAFAGALCALASPQAGAQGVASLLAAGAASALMAALGRCSPGGSRWQSVLGELARCIYSLAQAGAAAREQLAEAGALEQLAAAAEGCPDALHQDSALVAAKWLLSSMVLLSDSLVGARAARRAARSLMAHWSDSPELQQNGATLLSRLPSTPGEELA